MRVRFTLVVLLAFAGCVLSACSRPQHRHLLIVVDGLRPDYVTREVMPHLTALGQRGVVFTHHHSVFPTVTRVNASSISTGSYTETHGLMGNSVFFPEVDPTRFLDTSNRGDLLRIDKATGGHLLTAPTLGGSLQAAGKKMLVVSSGSSGSSFLLNHTVAGGAILHYEYALPETLEKDMQAALGEAPSEDSVPSGTLDARAVDSFFKIGLPKIDPTVTVMWLSDLDTTAHDHGIGDPATVDVLRKVDAQIARIEDGLRSAGLWENYNIWVTSDHGFSTHTGAADISAILKPYAGTLPDGSPRIVSGGGAIYVRDHNADIVSTIAAGLQKTSGIGAIFTRGSERASLDGSVPGTLSFDVAHWDHERSAEILYSPDWKDAENAHGFRGATAAGGVAGHGSSSPYEIHNTLIAAGPDLKSGAAINVPSGNVDFAPTFLHLLGIAIPKTMQGRVLEEAFANGPKPELVKVESADHTVGTADGSYVLTATFSTVTSSGKSYRYFDQTKVQRR